MSGLLAAFSIGLIGTAVADDKHDRSNGRLNAQNEIEDLMSCYAYSFDAIARATTATFGDFGSLDFLDPMNNNDPNFAEGLQRFQGCTTEDFVVEFFLLDGTPLLLEGNIPPGPLPFVNLVNILARDGGQTNTQHLFGSFSNTVHGNKGTVTAYAIIHTTVDDDDPDTPPVTTSGTSTYNSEVVFRQGKWLLKKTTVIIN